jgi:ATP-dependent Clp protease ATP-binding subunit ClpA
VLLVGVHGVGKTALARAALDRLPPSVVVFDATAAQVNAGAIYIGELEARVKALAEKLRGHSVVWHLPNLEEAHYAGQHTRSPHGMLDAMLPHIESGALRLVAEVTPQTLESLLAERPRLATAFQALEVRPLGEREAMAVARETVGQLDVAVHVSEQTLRSGFELANQFLPRAAPPGSLLRLVRAAVETSPSGRATRWSTRTSSQRSLPRPGSRSRSWTPRGRSRSTRCGRSSASA